MSRLSRVGHARPGVAHLSHGHRHDMARYGYVTLPAPSGRPATGDAGRVEARVAVQEARLTFRPLTDALVEGDRRAGGAGLSLIQDVGAGTGRHLCSRLEAAPMRPGGALIVVPLAMAYPRAGHAPHGRCRPERAGACPWPLLRAFPADPADSAGPQGAKNRPGRAVPGPLPTPPRSNGAGCSSPTSAPASSLGTSVGVEGPAPGVRPAPKWRLTLCHSGAIMAPWNWNGMSTVCENSWK